MTNWYSFKLVFVISSNEMTLDSFCIDFSHRLNPEIEKMGTKWGPETHLGPHGDLCGNSEVRGA